MSFLRYTIVVLSLLLLTTYVKAASFDCTRTSTKVEKLVCSDTELSKSDDKLTDMYTDAMKETDDKKLLRKEQREWLENVRNRCEDVICLKKVYAARITKLASGTMEVKDTPPLKTIKSDKEICQAIRTESEKKEPANFSELSQGRKLRKLCGYRSGFDSVKCKGDVNEITLKELTSKDSGLYEKLTKLLSRTDTDLSFAEVTEIDVNNDGLPDIWLSSWGGKLSCQRNYFFLRTKKGTYIHKYHFAKFGDIYIPDEGFAEFDGRTSEGAFCEGDHVAFRQIDGLTYLVIVYDREFFVYLPQASGELRKICSFKP